MVIWFVLINTSPTDEHMVYNQLCRMDEIEYVYPLFGEWDLIIKLVADSDMILENIMIEKIKTIKGILSVKTLIG